MECNLIDGHTHFDKDVIQKYLKVHYLEWESFPGSSFFCIFEKKYQNVITPKIYSDGVKIGLNHVMDELFLKKRREPVIVILGVDKGKPFVKATHFILGKD